MPETATRPGRERVADLAQLSSAVNHGRPRGTAKSVSVAGTAIRD